MVLHVYNSHLSCLFPQAGPGKKHQRAIALEPWQAERVAAAPWAFLRGCIRSDGCVFVNRTGPYEYLTYDFYNLSAEIRQLFVDACQRARTGVSTGREPRADQQPGERGAAARARRRQVLSCVQHANLGPQAAVVKLVYTQASGVCGLTPVEVRVLSAAYRRPVASLVSGSPAAIV